MAESIDVIIFKLLGYVSAMMNTPGNQWYLPTWLANNGYDPYAADKALSWSVELTDQNAVNAAASICPTINIPTSPCAANATFIGTPGTNPSLQLGDGSAGGLQITGGSNAYMVGMAPDNSNPYLVKAYCGISELPAPLPQNMAVTGRFLFNQSCCCSVDGSTCSVAPSTQTGMGTFTATMISSPMFAIDFQITKLAQWVLELQVNGITLTLPYKPGTQEPDMNVAVSITSIPQGADPQAYNEMVINAFNSPSTLESIAAQISTALNDPSQLTVFSQVLTQAIDYCLQLNNLYPFGPLPTTEF